MIANVVGMGARGPLGLSVLQVAMGLRSGLFAPRSIKLVDKHDEPIGIGITGGIGETVHGLNRFVVLAAPTFSEAVADLPETLAPTEEQPLPVLLCLPEPGRPDHEERFEGEIIAMIAERSGVALDADRSEVIQRGQPGFAFAVERARDLLDGGTKAVAIAGVDSYYHPDVLRWLDESYRLESLEAEDGFIPSEAAACIVLTRGKKSKTAGAIVDVATGTEPSVTSDEANVAEAMTKILADLTARRGAPFTWAISDINGERERGNEWDKAAFRILDPESRFDKWVWEMGDVGAATGPLFTAVGLQLCALGAAPQPTGVVALHAEGPDRGAVVFRGTGAEERA
jgi:3-oxoacyl-[acyl-carrier-protein] synthase-1